MTNTRPIQRDDEAAIRQLVQNMQDAQNTKNGELFASAFAQQHDYIAINGIFLPNQTRQDNARGLQGSPPYAGNRRGAHSKRIPPEERSRQ